MIEQHLYDVDELMKMLRCGRATAYAMLKSGRIPSVKVGRMWRVPEVALNQYLCGGSGGVEKKTQESMEAA